ncbi:MAG: YD repeat-containing protein [candidate division NC10 bacterium CSP1-5]|nr:MAG: YD repeat-containing protein [candidate division NC10 bacterium CSP1-5]
MTFWQTSGRSCLYTALACLGLLFAVPLAQAQTAALRATQDTYIRRLFPNQNQGDEAVLVIRALARNRPLLQFDQAQIAGAVGSGTLVSAKLRLTIVFNGNNWGAVGREVGVHRLTQPWTELGATWNCPDDTNVANHRPDCTQWDMGEGAPDPFVPTPTDVVRHRNDQTGVVEWDVTPDVAAFLAGTAQNVGWLLKAVDQHHTGHVQYASREGAAPPELVLEVKRPDVVPPGFGVVLGQVLDAASNQALPGTTIKALGTTSEVSSDAQGRFQLPALPGARVPIHVNRGGYVDAKVFAVVEAGRESTVGIIRLQPFDQVRTLIGPSGGSHTDSTGTVQILFPAGAVNTTTEVSATVFPTAETFPVALPKGQAYLAGVQFTPENLAFGQAVTVRIRLPGSLPLPVNTNVPFAFANHGDQNPETVFFDPGMARVIEMDGARFLEAPLNHFSCIGLVLPVQTAGPAIQRKSPDKGVESSKQKTCCPIGSRVGPHDGGVFLDQVLPSTRVLGRANPLSFTYSSATADPHPLLLMEATLDPAATTLPEQVRWRLRAGPLDEERLFTPQAGTFRYAWSWDAKDRNGTVLPTGSHRVEVTLAHDYQGTLATANSFGGPPVQDLGIPVPGLTPANVRPNARVVINNQQQSPFGAGWGLQGLQRLHPQPDGSVVITEGNGTALTFRTIPLLYAGVSPGTTTFGGMSALDPETGDIQFVFTSVIAPGQILPSPSGDFIFVATQDAGVRVIDGRTQTEIGFVGISFPKGVAVSPDGATLYVAASRPSAFYIVDVRSREIVFTLNLSGTGSALALSPDGRLAYVGATNDVVVVDTQTRSILATIPVGAPGVSGSMVLSADGRMLFVATGTGVAVIDTTTNTLQTTVNLGHAGSGLALTPAGRLFVTSRDTRVTVVDTNTLQIAQTITLPVSNSSTATVHPDGQRVLVMATELVSGPQRFRGFIFILGAATGAILERIPLPDGFAEGLAFRSGDPNRPLPPPGDFSSLTRNDNGTPQNPTDDTWVRRMKDGTEHLFSATGLHLETRNRNGNRTIYAYDAAGRLLNVTDPAGGVTSFSYAGGKLAGVTDPAGRTTQFSIDGTGNLGSVTTPDGATSQYSYDSRHRLTTRTDPRGGATQYEYDSFGRLSRVTHPTGEERTLLPSDAQGLLNNVPPGAAAAPISTDVVAQLTDGLSRTTQLRTDPLGAATQTVDPLGRNTIIQRSGHGLPLRITRPDNAVITLSYDSVGNLLQTEQIDPFTGQFRTTFTYEPVFNQVTSITDPKGNRTTIIYDTRGNPIAITDAMTSTSALAYNGRGLLTSVTDARGSVTAFTYDARGNLLTTTDPLGNVTSLSYDGAGNVMASTDALGRTTSFVYDGMNRLIQVTDAAGGITRYSYDLNGNLVSVTDARGQQTTFAYDAINQLSQTTNPLGQIKSFAYDLARNLVSTTDAKNQTITFAYDAGNQLTQKTLPNGEVVSFTYDLVGSLTLAQDADSQLTLQYDARGRLTRVDTAATAAQSTSTLSYVYDANGNRTQFSATVGGSGFTNIYTYDALNRLTRISPGFGLGQPPNFTYDALSRRTSATLGNGAVATYTYDAASQLTSLVHQLSGSPIASFSYAYDAAGNRTAMTEVAGTNSYAYDQLNRLTQATHPQPTNPAESFSYDPVGNRTSSHLATGQLHDSANRLLEDSNFTYTYDDNGNLTSKTSKANGEVTTYTYDAENQLIRVNKPGLVAEYRYDALGRRIEKVVNGVSTRYTYDNEDIAVELDGTGTAQAFYLHGPGIDEPLAMGRFGAGGGTSVFHADGLGSITTLTNTSGATVRSYTYDSFGRLVAQTGTVTNPYTYTGRELDPESGLYYYRARYYDAATGRFLQEDAIGGLVELPQTLNKYPYVLNDPHNAQDPLGLASVTIKAFLGVGVAITFGMDKNGNFIQVLGGVGLGAGVAFNPFGKFAVQPEDFDCELPVGTTLGLIGFSGQASASLGPFSAGVARVDGLGVAKAPGTVRPKVTSIEKTGPTVSISPKESFGLGASISAGVVVGFGGL